MSSREELVASYLARLVARKKIDVETLLPQGLGARPESALPPDAVEAARVAEVGVRQIIAGHMPTPEQTAGVEAIILPKIRPVLDVIDGDFRTDHPLWLKLNDD